uniref:Uncharacterized protein n=1 Tax=Mesocestoides corti TaxID=53468 RepID=A0A5K3EP84_MESCO
MQVYKSKVPLQLFALATILPDVGCREVSNRIFYQSSTVRGTKQEADDSFTPGVHLVYRRLGGADILDHASLSHSYVSLRSNSMAPLPQSSDVKVLRHIEQHMPQQISCYSIRSDVPNASSIKVATILHESGVNAGFQDSEALLSRHQDLTQPTPAAMTFVEENEGENANNTAMGASVSRLSCLAIPHRDSPPTEYRATPHPPKIFKGVPALPTYEDATKRGMYCIIRESDITAPPPYQYRVPDDDCDDDEAGPLSGGANGASHEAAVFASISSWDFDAYGVHRGSVNSMPEFSSIFGPPDSPYPGDVSSHWCPSHLRFSQRLKSTFACCRFRIPTAHGPTGLTLSYRNIRTCYFLRWLFGRI